MRRIQSIARSPIAIALFMSLAVAGCASKKNLPNNAGDLGLGAGAATPGSAQDFTVNVGDRIFFDLDSSLIRADAQQTLSSRPSGCSVIRSTRSRSKAMPTNAVRVNTTSLSASAVQPPPATSSLRAACRPTVCAPSPTAMNVRSQFAMPTRAGRRTAAPLPFSTVRAADLPISDSVTEKRLSGRFFFRFGPIVWAFRQTLAEVTPVIVSARKPSLFAFCGAKPLRTFAGNALKAELIVRQTHSASVQARHSIIRFA